MGKSRKALGPKPLQPHTCTHAPAPGALRPCLPHPVMHAACPGVCVGCARACMCGCAILSRIGLAHGRLAPTGAYAPPSLLRVVPAPAKNPMHRWQVTSSAVHATAASGPNCHPQAHWPEPPPAARTRWPTPVRRETTKFVSPVPPLGAATCTGAACARTARSTSRATRDATRPVNDARLVWAGPGSPHPATILPASRSPAAARGAQDDLPDRASPTYRSIVCDPHLPRCWITASCTPRLA